MTFMNLQQVLEKTRETFPKPEVFSGDYDKWVNDTSWSLYISQFKPFEKLIKVFPKRNESIKLHKAPGAMAVQFQHASDHKTVIRNTSAQERGIALLQYVKWKLSRTK